jgi:hypothetical protein
MFLMSYDAQGAVANFSHWLDEVVANGDWKAEAGFISTNFTVHDNGGTKRFSRDEWLKTLSSTHPPDWRLTVHDLIANRHRLGVLLMSIASEAQTGHPIVRHSIAVLHLLDGQFAEIWIASRMPGYGPWSNLAQSRAEWSVADDPPRPEEAANAAAMAYYIEIRQTREAEGLRELFVDPMIVHGPGATREESLDDSCAAWRLNRRLHPGWSCRLPTALLQAAKQYCDGATRIRTPPPSSPARLLV